MSAMPLEIASQLHLRDLATDQEHAPGTIRKYQISHRRFIGYLETQGKPTTIAQLTPDNARAFVGWLIEQRVSRETARQYLGDLKIWCRHLVDEDKLLPRSPLESVKVPRKRRIPKPALSRHEVGRLVAAASETRNPLRNRAMVLLALETGVRVSELCRVKLGDFRLSSPHAIGELRLLGKGRFGGKHRTVYFGGKASQAISRYQLTERRVVARAARHDSDTLFLALGGHQISRSTALSMVKHLADLAGITDKIVTPHTLRRTFASQNAPRMNAFILQALMGHADIKETRGYIDDAVLNVEGSYESLVDGWKEVR